MSSVQNPCWLMIIGDYTTLCIGDSNNLIRWNPYKPTSISWNDRGILNTAQMMNCPLPFDYRRVKTTTPANYWWVPFGNLT